MYLLHQVIHLQSVTPTPFLTPLLQESPTLSLTQVRAMNIIVPAVSSRLASASSTSTFDQLWRQKISLKNEKCIWKIFKKCSSLTYETGFILLENQTISSIRGTQGGWGGVSPAVIRLCSAALAAVQTFNWTMRY